VLHCGTFSIVPVGTKYNADYFVYCQFPLKLILENTHEAVTPSTCIRDESHSNFGTFSMVFRSLSNKIQVSTLKNKSRFSGLRHLVMMFYGTSVLEDLSREDGGSKFLRNVGILPQRHLIKYFLNAHFLLGSLLFNFIYYVFYEDISKSFRTGILDRELQMVQLSATRCSCVTIL
jgi:hypothetical protein